MEYPLRFKDYKLVKVYKNFGLYEDKNGFKTCFKLSDLGLISEVTRPKKNIDTRHRKYLY